MSPTADDAPAQPEALPPPAQPEALPPPAQPEATTPVQPAPQPTTERLSVSARLRAHPVLAGAAALVIAAGGAFGAGFAVGHATGDDWPGGIRARELSDLPMPQLPGGGELPGLRERSAPRDGGRDRLDRPRDTDSSRSKDRDSSTS